MRFRIFNKETNQYEYVNQQAAEVALIDAESNFESPNVEGALRELAGKVKDNAGIEEIKTNVASNTQSIKNLAGTTNKMKEDIEWLKENGGGGGGGSIVPTITSKFEDCAVQEGTNVKIPIFFSASSLGNGTAYVSINGIESMYVEVKQGNNTITIPAKHFTKMKNEVSIYVKDRVGLSSNLLEWTIIVGGIKINTTFDTTADWSVGSKILFPLNVTTEIEGEITLNLKVGVNSETLVLQPGYNEINLDEYINGVGAFPVEMVASVSGYTSNAISFNLVVSSSTELYISSTNVDGTKYKYGEKVDVNYRLSKKGDETFTVTLSIDNLVEKTIEAKAGNYYWTIAGGKLSVGEHVLTIRATSASGDDKSLALNVVVEKGEYTPLKISEAGLICDLNAEEKSNQDSNLPIWVDESRNGNDATIINANFSTNGFINDNLVLDNNAYVEIPISPWAENATNGSTINIIYTPIHSGNEYARVLDYTDSRDPYVGAFIDILEANVKSENNRGQIDLDYESGEIDVSFVIDRTKKMAKIFVDGILSKYWMLSDTGSGNSAILESFAHNNYIYLNSTKGEDCGTNNVRRVLIYNRALDEEEIMTNHIANITDMAKQEEKYNFEYNNTLPKLRIFGNIDNVSADVSANVRIRYESPNAEIYGESFDFETANNPIFLQGTSSLGYIRKNYRFFLKDAGGADYYFNPFGAGSKAENVFTIKCNYMESSHANGIGIASMVNDCVYDAKTPAQENDEDRRTAINGFPIQLFVNDESYGTYTLQIDRYAEESLGYKTDEFPELICVEGRSNTDIGAGAFYKYGVTDASKGLTEWEYYNESFLVVAPSSINEKNYDYNHIKTLVEWVYDAGRDRFVEELPNYFNKEYLLRYFLTVQCLGLVDSLSKNMHLCSYDGKIFYPLFYDSDTATGLDNSGYLDVSASCEIGDLLDAEGNVIERNRFNCSNSVLWTKVMDWLKDDLKAEWTKMRSSGRFSLDNIMHYMSENIIEKIPGTLYNADQVLKYCDYGSTYQHVCHGNRKLQLKKWIRERIAYVDSLMEYMSDIDYATIRMEKIGDASLDISTYYPLYYTVKWRSGVVERQRIGRGETKRFSTYSTVSTDQEVILYYPSAIKKVGNIDTLNPNSMMLGTCVRLNEIECHSTNLKSVDVSENIYLRKINFEGCERLGSVNASLNIGNCKYLESVNIYNTGLTALNTNSSGGSIKEIYYPRGIQNIILSNQTVLETLGLPFGEDGEEIPQGLASISLINCPNISKLNTSESSNINSSIIAMKNARNLTINNSTKLKRFSFEGFERLVNVSLASINTLEALGFDNMLRVGQSSTIKYFGLSNCPKLSTVTMNCTSNSYEIAFDEDGILDFGNAIGLINLRSNTSIKGLKTIILPSSMENLYFTKLYGKNASDIVNIWSSEVCVVNKEGTTPTVTHLKKHEGIDFKGLKIKEIDMAGLDKVTNAINFNITPITTNPNLNTNRDGSENKPWFRPAGVLNLTQYEGNIKTMLKGLDLDKISIILPEGEFEDSDISNLFEATLFEDAQIVNDILAKYPNAAKFDYIFKNSDLTDASSINFPTFRFTMKGAFMGSKLTSDIDIPLNCTDVSECFRGCKNMTEVRSNWNKNFTRINSEDCYAECTNIEYIDNKADNIDNIPYAWGGYEYTKDVTGIYVFEIPEDNYRLVLGDTIVDGGVSWGDGVYTKAATSHVYASAGTYRIKGKILVNPIASQPHASVKSTLKSVLQMPINVEDYREMYNGCMLLTSLDMSNSNKVKYFNNTLKDCTALITSPTIDFSSALDLTGLYSGCINLTNVKFINLANEAITDNIIDGCNKISTLTFNGKTNKVPARAIVNTLNNIITSSEANVSTLTAKVRKQDDEIVSSMLASVNMFEMVLKMLPVQMDVNSNYDLIDDSIIDVYIKLIDKKIKNVNDIPAVVKARVLQRM